MEMQKMPIFVCLYETYDYKINKSTIIVARVIHTKCLFICNKQYSFVTENKKWPIDSCVLV